MFTEVEMDTSTAKSPSVGQVVSTRNQDAGYRRDSNMAWGSQLTRRVQQNGDHLGVTDDQMAWIAAPAGDAFEDEPRQG
jgi:hypothetical protein